MSSVLFIFILFLYFFLFLIFFGYYYYYYYYFFFHEPICAELIEPSSGCVLTINIQIIDMFCINAMAIKFHGNDHYSGLTYLYQLMAMTCSHHCSMLTYINWWPWNVAITTQSIPISADGHEILSSLLRAYLYQLMAMKLSSLLSTYQYQQLAMKCCHHCSELPYLSWWPWNAFCWLSIYAAC